MKEPSIYDQIAELAGQIGAMNKPQSRGYRGSNGSNASFSGPQHPRVYRGGYSPNQYRYRGGYADRYQGGRGGHSHPRARGYNSRGRGWGATRGNRRVTSSMYNYRPRSATEIPKLSAPCAHYTRTGTCFEAKSCRFRHDPEHIALCIPFLKTGNCPKSGCTLSHVMKPENTPMCSHHAIGKCNRDGCRFAHMASVKENAVICRDFSLLGWCDKGLSCGNRHVFECPDFEANGHCPRDHCTLKHVVRHQEVVSAPKSEKDNKASVNVSAFLSALSSDISKEQPRPHSPENDGEMPHGESGDGELFENDNNEDIEEKVHELMASDLPSRSSANGQEQSENERSPVDNDFIEIH